MAILKEIYGRWNPLTLVWDDIYFKTSADLVVETSTKKIMTDTERTAISTYLSTFNAADKLVKVNSSGAGTDPGKIPYALIPDLVEYMQKAGGTFSGGVTFSSPAYFNAVITSDGGYINFSGLDTVGFDGAVLQNIGTPVNATDATNKSYVDGLAATGTKPAAGGPVFVATTSNYASFPTTGPITIDGESVLTADGQSVRVLVKSQTTLTQNGVYVVARAASNVVTWTRQAADSGIGTLVFVEKGLTNNDWLFHNYNGNQWTEFSKPDTVLADESTLTRSGNTLSIKAGGVNNAQIGASAAIAWSKLASEAGTESTAWASMTAATSAAALGTRLSHLLAAVKLLRGTTNYNTNNAQTIADAYNQLAHLAPSDVGAVAYLLSTANLASLSGTQTVDGVATGTDGKLIVLVGQSTPSQNGVYRTAAGVWTQVATFDKGGYYVATAGTSNANKVYKASDATTAAMIYNGTAAIPAGMVIFTPA